MLAAAWYFAFLAPSMRHTSFPIEQNSPDIASTAASNPYTAPLAAPIQSLQSQLQPKIAPIESKNVSIVAN